MTKQQKCQYCNSNQQALKTNQGTQHITNCCMNKYTVMQQHNEGYLERTKPVWRIIIISGAIPHGVERGRVIIIFIKSEKTKMIQKEISIRNPKMLNRGKWIEAEQACTLVQDLQATGTGSNSCFVSCYYMYRLQTIEQRSLRLFLLIQKRRPGLNGSSSFLPIFDFTYALRNQIVKLFILKT